MRTYEAHREHGADLRCGVVGAYVGDYAEGMELLRPIWGAAAILDSEASRTNEGVFFPLCRPRPHGQLVERAGLLNVQVEPFTVPAKSSDFDDLRTPFLGGAGSGAGISRDALLRAPGPAPRVDDSSAFPHLLWGNNARSSCVGGERFCCVASLPRFPPSRLPTFCHSSIIVVD